MRRKRILGFALALALMLCWATGALAMEVSQIDEQDPDSDYMYRYFLSDTGVEIYLPLGLAAGMQVDEPDFKEYFFIPRKGEGTAVNWLYQEPFYGKESPFIIATKKQLEKYVVDNFGEIEDQRLTLDEEGPTPILIVEREGEMRLRILVAFHGGWCLSMVTHAYQDTRPLTDIEIARQDRIFASLLRESPFVSQKEIALHGTDIKFTIPLGYETFMENEEERYIYASVSFTGSSLFAYNIIAEYDEEMLGRTAETLSYAMREDIMESIRLGGTVTERGWKEPLPGGIPVYCEIVDGGNVGHSFLVVQDGWVVLLSVMDMGQYEDIDAVFADLRAIFEEAYAHVDPPAVPPSVLEIETGRGVFSATIPEGYNLFEILASERDIEVDSYVLEERLTGTYIMTAAHLPANSEAQNVLELLPAEEIERMTQQIEAGTGSPVTVEQTTLKKNLPAYVLHNEGGTFLAYLYMEDGAYVSVEFTGREGPLTAQQEALAKGLFVYTPFAGEE